MGRRTTILALEQIREINMTPLIDLTFLLLITFIITFPLIEQSVPVNLPRGAAEDIDSSRARVITVDLKGQIYLDQQPIEKSALAAEMKALGEADPDVTVMVRADEGLRYGVLMEVVRILHDAKIARMGLVTAAEDAAPRP